MSGLDVWAAILAGRPVNREQRRVADARYEHAARRINDAAERGDRKALDEARHDFTNAHFEGVSWRKLLLPNRASGRAYRNLTSRDEPEILREHGER